MKELHIGNLTIKVPIIQGGMCVCISMSGLAAAVANEGGIGVIASAGLGMLEPDYVKNFIEANIRALKKEILKARELTNGILGVNIMVALENFDDLVKTSIQEGIDIIIAGAGLPLSMPQHLTKDSKTKLVPIVSSGRAAKILCSKWKEQYDYLPDAIVVEGPKAGGHLGFKRIQLDDPKFALEELLRDVLEQVKYFEEKYNTTIPVIAAGGIYTGADIKKIMDLGASGVQMGTRFVTTE
jgi:nitronate monooxygenase